MSEFRFSYPACVIAGKDHLTRQDIATLREIALPTGVQCEADVVALLAINNSCRVKCPDWNVYFVESICSFLIGKVQPTGILDDSKAASIQRLFSTGGLILTSEELALVMALVEGTPEVPEWLAAFALDQLRLALQLRHGAYAQTRPQGALGITAADLRFVERIISATLDDDETIAPGLAAVLENIDAVAVAPFNHSVWGDLMSVLRGATPERYSAGRDYGFRLVTARHPKAA